MRERISRGARQMEQVDGGGCGKMGWLRRVVVKIGCRVGGRLAGVCGCGPGCGGIAS